MIINLKRWFFDKSAYYPCIEVELIIATLESELAVVKAENEKLRRILFELYLDSGGNEGCDEIDEKFDNWLKQKLEKIKRLEGV